MKILDSNMFDELAEEMSNMTELIEAFDWDEDLAVSMIETALEKIVDIYEFCKIDEELVTNNEEFLTVLRANLPKITDNQFDILMKIIDSKMLEMNTKNEINFN